MIYPCRNRADSVPGRMTGSAEIPASSGAVVRKGSGEQAAAYIRQLIFDGQLQEGMRLAQDDVAKAVGVSRIPIREAIIALEREGWVTTKLHRGTFVNAFDEHVIRDHYELFGLVYGLAARRAASARGPEIVAHLTDLSKQIGETDDLVRIGDLALAFHSSVVGAAHSPRITVVLRAMSALGARAVLRPRAAGGRFRTKGSAGDRPSHTRRRRGPCGAGVLQDAQQTGRAGGRSLPRPAGPSSSSLRGTGRRPVGFGAVAGRDAKVEVVQACDDIGGGSRMHDPAAGHHDG